MVSVDKSEMPAPTHLRVLHLMTAPPGDYLPGTWYAFIRELSAHGVSSCFALPVEFPSAWRPQQCPVFEINSVNVWRLDVHRAWIRVIRQTDPSVIQIWGESSLGFGLASRVCFRRIPHLCVADSNVRSSGWSARLAPFFDAIVLPSRSPANVTDDPPDSGDVEVIPPFFSQTEKQSPESDRAELLQKVGLPQDARIILTAGRLEPGFGIREAIWVFDILKYTDSRLWLVIVGDGSLRSSLESFASTLGRGDVRVKFLGWTGDSVSWLRAASMLWLLGSRGGVGWLNLATTLQTPCIARHRPDFVNVVPPTTLCQYVSAADKHLIAKVSRELLDRRAGANSTARGDLAHGATFAGHQIVRHWVSIYHRLLRQRVVPI